MFHASLPISPASGSSVGTISRWDPDTEKSYDPMTIYSRDEIYVGRDKRRCQYVVDDLFVSNKHLWIYTVIFDQDHPEEVAPLVYAQDISANGTSWNGYRMGNGRSSYLLSDGDILRLSDSVYFQYNSETDTTQQECFTQLQRLEVKAFAQEYVVTRRKLGSGAYGRVHMAYKRSTGQQFACKIIDLLAVKMRLSKMAEARHQEMREGGIDAVQRQHYASTQFLAKLAVYSREAKILETLQHPNIIGLEKVIKSNNTIYMFQDLVTAGDLFSYIQYKGGKLPDIEAAVIVRQIVIALDYLHRRNIVHRDLKPDNILMTSRADGCRVVLSDFGCARVLNSDTERLSTMVGTLEFSAPEVLNRSKNGYNKAADMWSLGCLTVTLLTGELPFKELKTKSFESEQLSAFSQLNTKLDQHNVGHRAKSFIFRLLVHDESVRMDVKEALRHSWFTNRSHNRDFEALYLRSIRGWKPRAVIKPLIVWLSRNVEPPNRQQGHASTLRKHASSESYEKEHGPVFKTEPASQGILEFFPSTDNTDNADDEVSNITWRFPSETLSDPNLPPRGNIDECSSQPSRMTSSEIGTGLPAVLPTALASKVPSNPSIFPPDYKSQRSFTTYQAVATPPSSPTVSHRVRLQLIEPRASIAPAGPKSEMDIKRSHSSLDEGGGEVYEEVGDPVTGKRQNLLYGACAVKME